MTTKNKNVLILGYGEMGHAMAHLLCDHHTLFIWDKYPATGFNSVTLDEAVPQADLVLFCLPVIPHREIAMQILPLLQSHCICISIAKGLDEAGETAAQIFSDIFKNKQPYALLYGPMISEEIRADRYAFAQAGCSNDIACASVTDLFSDTRLITKKSPDITGITWSVILKNVYAMLFGMADELSLGDNVRGYLLTESLHELDKIVQCMGGEEGSPYSLAGLGDLVTTATSEDSRHHELGRMLARGEQKNITGEGVHTLEMIEKYSLLNEKDFPLFHLVHTIVHNPENTQQQIEGFLKGCQ